jgi:hypothetical protein
MSFTLTFGQEGPCATAQVVWSVNNETYNFRSDNNFIGWISTIFTVADYLSSSGGNTNPLVLPDNTNPNGWSLNTLDSGGVGGSITMIGSTDGTNSSNSGTIDLSAGNADGSPGGSIDLRGGSGSTAGGGSLIMMGGIGPAGSINTSGVLFGGDTLSGGSINTSAGQGTGGSLNLSGEDAPGGNIDCSNGGGNIYLYSGGGSITSIGGDNPGGSINLTSSGNGTGGFINTYGQDGGANGGYIATNGGDDGGDGGFINTSGDVNQSGGSINTRGVEGVGSGGSIDTSGGGGSIDTTGTGSIGFGTSGIRTTVVGSATGDRTITMPDSSGTMAVILVGSDTIDFPNIPANSTATHDVTIVGVIPGEAVLVTCTDVRTGNDQRVIFTGFVASTPDTVTVLATNTSGAGINLPSLSFKIIVFRGL